MVRSTLALVSAGTNPPSFQSGRKKVKGIGPFCAHPIQRSHLSLPGANRGPQSFARSVGQRDRRHVPVMQLVTLNFFGICATGSASSVDAIDAAGNCSPLPNNLTLKVSAHGRRGDHAVEEPRPCASPHVSAQDPLERELNRFVRGLYVRCESSPGPHLGRMKCRHRLLSAASREPHIRPAPTSARRADLFEHHQRSAPGPIAGRRSRKEQRRSRIAAR